MRLRSIPALVGLTALTVSAALAVEKTPVLPAGTRIKFHVTAPISSNKSKTGEAFAFVLNEAIVSGGVEIPIDGTTGAGTVYLAGHAGSGGHEGDLTLRIDTLQTADGRKVTFADQRFEINGKNHKLAAGLFGLVPYAGMGARFIRGSEAHVEPATPIETVLLRPANVTFDALVVPLPSPVGTPLPEGAVSPAPSAAATALPSAAPSATASADVTVTVTPSPTPVASATPHVGPRG